MAGPSTESIWTQLSSDLRRFIRRRVPDEHVADDLLQETFVRIHRRLGSLQDADRLAAWVYQIARNVIHDHYRASASGTTPLVGDPVDDIEDTGDADELSCRKSRAREWLAEMIQQLPASYQDAVRWAELEEVPQQEVANRLGLSLSGAKSRIQRGRALLHGALDQCCQFEFDQRGNLLNCDPRPNRTACRNCEDGEA